MAQLINDLKALLLKSQTTNTEKDANRLKINFNENKQHKKHLSFKFTANINQVQSIINEKEDKSKNSHVRNFSFSLNSPKNNLINKENVCIIKKNVRSNTVCLYENGQSNEKQDFTNTEKVIRNCKETNMLAPLSKDFISDDKEYELKSQIEMIARQGNLFQNSFYPSK